MLLSEAILGLIEEAGPKFVFGVPGSTTVAPISSIMRSKKVKFVFALHENSSLGMADGYARQSGEIGVVLLHTAPGLTTALPNLYNSFVDDVPLLVIVGDVNSKSLIREPALALSGLHDMIKPLTKWSYYATSSSDALNAIRRSLNILFSPQPGPCCVIIPEDFLEDPKISGESQYEVGPKKNRMALVPEERRIEETVAMIDRSNWPVLIVGREIKGKDSVEALSYFCSKLSIPVLLESPYPGAYSVGFPQNHPCYLGLFRRELDFLREADLVIALGGQVFTERKYYRENPLNPKSKLVHISSKPWELGKNFHTDIQILANPEEVAKMMDAVVVSQASAKRNEDRREARREKIDRIANRKRDERKMLLSQKSTANSIKPWSLVNGLNKVLRDRDDYVIVDEGVVASSYLAELFDFSKVGTLVGRSAGCLGWGINAAIGAKLASPRKKVIAFVGDGALLFGPQGLWTAANLKISLVVIVCNNSGYASVSLSFDSFGKRTKASVNDSNTVSEIQKPEIDIAKLCEGLGAHCISIFRERELVPMIKKALSSDKVEVIDVHLDPKERGYEGSVGSRSSWT